jgi:phosphoserine phosphatase RsbU/P
MRFLMRFGSAFRSAVRWVAVLALAACATALAAQSFDLERDRELVVSLDGLWRFHPGDSPLVSGSSPRGEGAELWAQPGFDDQTWPLLRSDESWSDQGYPNMSGYGWYRFTIHLPPGPESTSLMLAPIITSFEVYVDGKLVGRSGDMPPHAILNLRIFPQVYPLTPAGSSTSRNVLVAIRVWHSPVWSSFVGGGTYRGGHLAGDSSILTIERKHQAVTRDSHFVDYYSYSISSGIIGIAILCLFFIRPKEQEYLWFALMLLAQSIDSALYVSKEIYAFPPVPIYDLSDGICVALNFFAAFCFFSKVLRYHARRIGRACLALVVLSPLPAIAYWPGWATGAASATIQLLCLLPAAAWIFYVLGKRALAGNLDARLLLVPTLLDIGFYVADNVAIVLNQAGLTKLPRILERPLPLPPFTMQTGVFLHIFFLAGMLVFLIRRFALARGQEEKIAQEREAGRQIQLILLPDQLDQSRYFTVECAYFPAEQVGGDFFQQIADDDGGMTIVIGDVSGKGLMAATMVSLLVGAIRAEASHGANPATLLASLNERMMGRSRGGFTTCLAARFSSTGLMTVANAGHLAPYLNGEEIELPGALPLGILEGAEYETITVQLAPGDTITFMTDGVPEAQTKAGELFGFERTREVSTQAADRIAEAACSFGQSDDVTVVTAEFMGAEVGAAAD